MNAELRAARLRALCCHHIPGQCGAANTGDPGACRSEHFSENLVAHDAALEAAGYQIVPKEPTAAMIYAGGGQITRDQTDEESAGAVWLAMLAAAKEGK